MTLNLAYVGVEASAALTSGSVALIADSVDFLEDASVSLLALAGLALPPQQRARLGQGLAALLLVPTLATLAAAVRRLMLLTPPDATTLGLVSSGALIVNAVCALLLARHRRGGSLTKAAFLSARNDVVANLAMIAAGLATLATRSPWPDLVVGLSIGILNAGAAWEVWTTARDEHRSAQLR